MYQLPTVKVCPCEPPTKSVLNDSDVTLAFNVSSPFDGQNLTKSSVYVDCVLNVKLCPSGSVSLLFELLPLPLHSSIVIFSVVIDGSLLG